MKKINLIAAIILLPLLSLGQIINVPNDQPNIQAGINAAMDGDTVLVEDGTYDENIKFMGKAITVASHFLIDGDEDHIDNTIIDGSSATNPDSAATVMFVNGEDTNSIISGFTITGGSGIINSAWNSRYGGGIACWESGAKIMHNKIIDNEVSDSQLSSGGAGIGTGVASGSHWIVIENNEINNNSAFANADFAFGGGIYLCINGIVKNNTIENNICFNAGTQADGGGIEVEQPPGLSTKVTISNNLINDNDLECHRSEGAGIMIISGEVTIHDNIISNNYNTAEGFSLGAGIMCRYADKKIQILNNSILGNSGSLGENVNVGSGICILEAYDVEFIIDANIISNNIALHGGGFYERRSYNIHFTNNVFSENSADLGGALSMFHPSSDLSSSKKDSKEYHPVFINNTFYGNTANDYAGAIRYEGSANNPIFLNSIFWENDAPESKDIINYNNADLYISYCNINPDYITGTWIGSYNILVDPDFVDDVCHLSGTSQCIEEGMTSIDINGQIYNCPDFDIDGQIRPLNATADIGADEVLISGLVNKTEMISLIRISPNPVIGTTQIYYTINDQGIVICELYDISGKKVKKLINENKTPGTYNVEVDLSELIPGVYHCTLKTNEVIQTKKIIKL